MCLYPVDVCLSVFMLTAVLFARTKKWSQPGCQCERERESGVHVPKGVLFDHEQQWHCVTCRTIEGLGGSRCLNVHETTKIGFTPHPSPYTPISGASAAVLKFMRMNQ